MSAVLNDRDAILQAATVRIVNPKNAWINLSTSAPGFHVTAAGQADLSVVTVTAELFGLDDAVTFSAVGATLSNAAGRSVDVTYAGKTAIVTATVVSNGDEFKRSIVIPVLRDGASGTGTPGAPGMRGAGHYYATGSTWSDVIAQAACPGSTPVLNDVVTISSSTYAMEKRWTGSAWIETGVVIPGGLIVPGTILGSAIKAGTLDLRAPDGSIVIAANAPLSEQTKSNPNILERVDLWINEGAAWTHVDTAAPPGYAQNGIHKVFPNSDFALMRSRTFQLNHNTDYTLSFKATNDGLGGPRDVICDLFPDDLPEGVVRVEPGMREYEVHFRTATQASLDNCQIRIFTGAGASQLLIYDVKLERGKIKTSWNDVVLDWRTINNYVAPGAIGNTQIGGDIFSTTWNGYTDTRGAGWLMQRNGDIYCNSLRARGYIATGDINGWGWPAPGGRGSYFGPEGILLGNNITGQGAFLEARSDGTILAPGFSLVNRQLTLDNTILYNARIQVSLSATLSFTNQRNRANTFNYENFTAFATVSGAVGNLRYQWSLTVVEGDAMMTSDPSATSCSFRCRGQNITVSVNIGLVLIDEGSGAVVSRSIRCLVGYGNGA